MRIGNFFRSLVRPSTAVLPASGHGSLLPENTAAVSRLPGKFSPQTGRLTSGVFGSSTRPIQYSLSSSSAPDNGTRIRNYFSDAAMGNKASLILSASPDARLFHHIDTASGEPRAVIRFEMIEPASEDAEKLQIGTDDILAAVLDEYGLSKTNVGDALPMLQLDVPERLVPSVEAHYRKRLFELKARQLALCKELTGAEMPQTILDGLESISISRDDYISKIAPLISEVNILWRSIKGIGFKDGQSEIAREFYAFRHDLAAFITVILGYAQLWDRDIMASRPSNMTLLFPSANIPTALHNIQARMTVKAAEKGMTISVPSSYPDELNTRQLDHEKLNLWERVVQELVKNEIVHSGGSRVDVNIVTGGEDGGTLLVEVKGNGRKISPEKLARYGTVHEATDAENGILREHFGSHNVVSIITRDLNGEYTLTSDDNGTIFRFSIPLRALDDEG